MRYLADFLTIRFDDILLTPTFNKIPIKPNTSFKLEKPGIMISALERYKTLSREELNIIEDNDRRHIFAGPECRLRQSREGPMGLPGSVCCKNAVKVTNMYLFFVRHFNDIDHLTPVAWKLQKDSYPVAVFCMNLRYDIQQDYRLQFLKDHGVIVDYLYDAFDQKKRSAPSISLRTHSRELQDLAETGIRSSRTIRGTGKMAGSEGPILPEPCFIKSPVEFTMATGGHDRFWSAPMRRPSVLTTSCQDCTLSMPF